MVKMTKFFWVVTPCALFSGKHTVSSLEPWRWRQYISPKRWCLPTSPQPGRTTSSLFCEGQRREQTSSKLKFYWVYLFLTLFNDTFSVARVTYTSVCQSLCMDTLVSREVNANVPRCIELVRRISEELAASIIRSMMGGNKLLWDVGPYLPKPWRNIPGDSYLHTCLRENLGSHLVWTNSTEQNHSWESDTHWASQYVRNRKVHCRIHKSPPTVSIQSHINPIHNLFP
jgi:hypothetical protein